MAKDNDITPLIASADTRREIIRQRALEAIQDAFPVVGARTSLELESPEVVQKTYSSNDQKRAVIEGKSIIEPIRADVILRDNASGKVLDKTKATVAHLPWFTPRNTFIVDGNEYSVASQLRLRPGIYTRMRGNQELEAQFNLSKGKNFKLQMAPNSGVFAMQLGTTNVPVYGLLKSLGVSDTDINRRWGTELASINKAAWDRGQKDRIGIVFSKLYPSHRGAVSRDEQIQMIQDYFDSTRMSGAVNAVTLGKAHDRVSGEALLDASSKLLSVYKQEEEPDDRDSLQFKTIHQVDDLLAERIRLDARSLSRKFKQKMDHTNERDAKRILSTAPFTKGIKTFLTTSSLAKLPTQYNPIEIMDAAQRITSLGEGGIENSRAVMSGSRTVHPSHLSVIDPIVTSESPDLVGVDVRATFSAAKDREGNIYSKVTNQRSGKTEYVPIDKLTASRLAFPGQLKRIAAGKDIPVMYHGTMQAVKPSEVDYRIPSSLSMHGFAANLLPFLNSMQGNRALMASKHITQALPLVEKEAPYVQVARGASGESSEKFFGQYFAPRSPTDGVVHKIDDEYIHIKPVGEGTKTAAAQDVRVSYDNNFPLATKTFLHNDLTIKPGDRVTAGQPLGDSVITKDGSLAYGRNLNVALMAYKGMNSNDAVVISESAAKKLTSSHMYKEMLVPTENTKVDARLHKAQFGNVYTQAQYQKLAPSGVIKKGSSVEPGDILIAALEKAEPSAGMALLGKLHKSLMRPFRDAAITWTHDHPGEVIDVFESSRRIVVTVKTNEPMKLGDKLSGRHGNKGVVSTILSDTQMPQAENGEPLDVLFTSAGVVSRINPSQVLEMAIGKVARKTGEPIAVPAYNDTNNVQMARDLLKKHGLKDKETVLDPETGRKIPGIMVGNAYIMKLMKTTDTNFSARGVDKYDVNQQPSKGGTEGAKSIGMMEFSALTAQGAKNFLRDAAVIKGQRNDEYWQRIRRGLPPPPVKTSFAYDKFGSMLTAAGVKFDQKNDVLQLSPLTNKDVLGMSSGEIKNPLLVRASDLRPENGGLFDTVVTGGSTGTKWGHIRLQDPVINPVFAEPARRLLGLTQAELDKLNEEKGGAHVKRALDDLDLTKLERQMRSKTKDATGSALDTSVKTLKYVKALKKLGLKAGDAYTLQDVPVIPPVMRPVIPDKSGNLMVNDTNYLYRDVILANEGLAAAKDVSPETRARAKKHLQNSVGALFGLREPVSPQAASKNARGFISLIAGRNPKEGFVQSKLLSKRQDLSGRGTVIPDVTMNMDEIGLPEDMGWKMYEPFVVGRLVRKGYPATQAKKLFEDRAEAARIELHKEVAERPVVWNRAPTLHRFNTVSAYPRLIQGKSIRIPGTWPEAGMAMDYDGDAVQVHVPVSAGAVNEAKQMTLPNLLFSDRVKSALLVKPQHEAIYGLYKAQEAGNKSGGKKVKVTSVESALEAYRQGLIGLNDKVD